MTQQALTNDSFLNLLNELSEELEMISTTNALTTNVEGDDDIENAVTKCQAIVDVLATDIIENIEAGLDSFRAIIASLKN